MGPQGDHVTAYSLIKAMVYSVITDCQPDIAVKRLFGITTTVQKITEEKVDVLSQQLSNIRKRFSIFSDEELQRLDNIFKNIGKTSDGKKEVKKDEKGEKDQALLEKIKRAIQIQEIHCLEENEFLQLVASTGEIEGQVAHWGMGEKEYKDLVQGVNGFTTIHY